MSARFPKGRADVPRCRPGNCRLPCRGRYYALDDYCPHIGTSLGDSDLRGEQVVCNRHMWAFSLIDGSSPDVPTLKAETFEVRIVGGDEIQVRLPVHTKAGRGGGESSGSRGEWWQRIRGNAFRRYWARDESCRAGRAKRAYQKSAEVLKALLRESPRPRVSASPPRLSPRSLKGPSQHELSAWIQDDRFRAGLGLHPTARQRHLGRSRATCRDEWERRVSGRGVGWPAANRPAPW